MKINKAFLATQIVTFLSVLFYVLLFRHLGNIFVAFTSNDLGALENLTEEKAINIETSISQSLKEESIERSLYRYFVFFYLDDYTKRQVFVGSQESSVTNPSQSTDNDPFYTNMIGYHLNNVCFLQNTTDIPKSSIVYTNLQDNSEVDPSIFYISCPIFVNDVLVGYIGGLNRKEDGSISVETAAVRNAVGYVESILEGKHNATK